MKQRAITSVYIVLASVLAILSKLIPVVGDYIFDIFILGVTIVAGIEICNMMEANKRKLNKLIHIFYLSPLIFLIARAEVMPVTNAKVKLYPPQSPSTFSASPMI